MDPRARSEARINRLDTYSGSEFERALSRVILRRRSYLDFYTTEQLEEIGEQMVRDAWFSHKLNRENRANAAEAAYLDHQKALMETGGPDDSAYRRDMNAAGRGHLLGRS